MMTQFRFNTFAATLVASAGLAFLTLPATVTTAAAQSVTKQCSTQYQAAKAAGTLKGQKWPDFLSDCSAKLKDDDTATAPAAKTPAKKEAKETTTKAKKTETAAAAPSAGMSGKAITKECSTQYQSAKTAGTLKGQTWPQFLSACSDDLKADNANEVPEEPVVAPKKATASKTATTQTAAKTTDDNGKPLSPAQIAFRSRISECGEQWQQCCLSPDITIVGIPDIAKE